MHSIHVDFVEFEVDNPSIEFMVDVLEFLPKEGVVAIDIWHPRIQAIAGVTDPMESATEAVTVLQWGPTRADAADEERARAVAAVDVVLDLAPDLSTNQADGVIGKLLPGVTETWNAARIREIREIGTAKEI